MGAPRPVSLKVRALQWLAQREYSPQELRARLIAIAARLPEGEAAEDDARAAAARGRPKPESHSRDLGHRPEDGASAGGLMRANAVSAQAARAGAADG